VDLNFGIASIGTSFTVVWCAHLIVVTDIGTCIVEQRKVFRKNCIGIYLSLNVTKMVDCAVLSFRFHLRQLCFGVISRWDILSSHFAYVPLQVAGTYCWVVGHIISRYIREIVRH